MHIIAISIAVKRTMPVFLLDFCPIIYEPLPLVNPLICFFCQIRAPFGKRGASVTARSRAIRSRKKCNRPDPRPARAPFLSRQKAPVPWRPPRFSQIIQYMIRRQKNTGKNFHLKYQKRQGIALPLFEEEFNFEKKPTGTNEKIGVTDHSFFCSFRCVDGSDQHPANGAA